MAWVGSKAGKDELSAGWVSRSHTKEDDDAGPTGTRRGYCNTGNVYATPLVTQRRNPKEHTTATKLGKYKSLGYDVTTGAKVLEEGLGVKLSIKY